MNPETELNEKESLELISKMIHSAKETISNDGIYYQIWGWGVFIASLLQFYLQRIDYAYPFIPWAILMPACGVAMMFAGWKKERKVRVKTFVEDYLKFLWIAFGISLFVVLVFMPKHGPDVVYPVVMILYGIGTFVSGGALKFMPLKAGGIICWILAVISVNVTFDYQLLLLAASVLLAYIIPGFLLQRKYVLERRELMNAGYQHS